MLIFSRAPLFLWAEAIATACYTQNRSIIHRRFNKTPYELINGRKPDISFLHVFGALCYPKNDREDIGEAALLRWLFEQKSLKPRLQSMTSGQISSGLDLTYAPSTITTQQPTEGELDLLFEAMYDDYIGGQPSAAPRTARLLKHLKFFRLQRLLQQQQTPHRHQQIHPLMLQILQHTSQDVGARYTTNMFSIKPETIVTMFPNAMFDENSMSIPCYSIHKCC
ncbi:retrovirus-related pol polyprotein from transposon TNT 1-94 [Tanacetum coccineum]|uniref:Retrovirus-related pol polyprotein from transposon TNT 1-94 n=1 Tax=Tanacetum coccineum TaxID=301880 RepID=A0ABQ5F8G6_9ASTR